MEKRTSRGRLKREFSAGGVVFKTSKEKKILWLLINPAGTKRWQLPKGLVDENEKVIEAAVREVKEEGGVEIEALQKIGTSQFFYFFKGQKIFKTVTYFLMRYLEKTKKGHDKEVNKVTFRKFDKAYEMLTFKNDKKILEQAKKIKESGIQEVLI